VESGELNDEMSGKLCGMHSGSVFKKSITVVQSSLYLEAFTTVVHHSRSQSRLKSRSGEVM
jgi:hypothetical protein